MNEKVSYLLLLCIFLLGIWLYISYNNDLIVQIRIHRDGAEMRNIFYLKDNQMKVVAENKTIIFQKGKMVLLNRKHKIYWMGKLEMFDQNLTNYRKQLVHILSINKCEKKDKILQDFNAKNSESKSYPIEDCRINITPDFETIAGYVTRKYQLVKNNSIVEEVWIAENFKNYIRYNLDLNLYNDFMDRLLQQSKSPMYENLELFMNVVKNGFPMKIRTYGEGNYTESEVISIFKKNLDDSIFAIPKIYNEVNFDQVMN